MPAIRAVKNQYRGVNAHLHSLMQGAGGWDGFHTNHIADLMRLMSVQLLPMGYIVDIQQSLQIRRAGFPAGRPESDVTIYDSDPFRPQRPFAGAVNAQAMAIPDAMRIEDELSQYQAISIYEAVPGERAPGKPVAWVELLSPSNKPGGQDAAYYHDKRLKVLHSGIVFVEIDYLHESISTFDAFPRYNTEDSGAHPYHIVVVDPRPSLIEGKVYPYSFDVDDDIPPVKIPLNGADVLEFSFAAPYDKTFSETLYGARLVDYSQQPLNFDRYSRDDQARILSRMLTIVTAAAKGLDLEANAPLPLIDNPNDEPPYGKLP